MKNVRNFWIEITVDGKKQRVALGPVSKDGGFDLTVFMRSEGDPVRAVDLYGRTVNMPDKTVKLVLDVKPSGITKVVAPAAGDLGTILTTTRG